MGQLMSSNKVYFPLELPLLDMLLTRCPCLWVELDLLLAISTLTLSMVIHMVRHIFSSYKTTSGPKYREILPALTQCSMETPLRVLDMRFPQAKTDKHY